MMNFFDKISSFLDLIFDFIINIVKGLGDFIDIVMMLPHALSLFLPHLPSTIMAGVTAFFSIMLLKTLIGRVGSQ